MTLTQQDVYACAENVVAREIVGETILVPVSGELANLQEVFSLNDTGAFIWERIDGQTALGQIAHALCDQFDVDEQTAWADLGELIAELHTASLIHPVD